VVSKPLLTPMSMYALSPFREMRTITQLLIPRRNRSNGVYQIWMPCDSGCMHWYKVNGYSSDYHSFIHDELGWDQSKVDDLLMPIIQKMNRRNQVWLCWSSSTPLQSISCIIQATSLNRQGDLNGFLNVASGAGSHAPRKRQTYNSKRLQQVVTEFRKEQAKMHGRRATTPASDHGDQGNNVTENDMAPPKKRRKTGVSRKGKGIGKETGPTEDETTRVPTAQGKRRPRTTTDRSRKKKQTQGGEESDDRSDSEDEFAGTEGTPAAMMPSAPLAVQLRPRVQPRIRQARKQGDLSPSDPADKL